MSGLCALTLAGALATIIPGDAFTLAWTHSVEKVRWEEDYVIDGGVLRLTEARIKGSGAGMEPPEGAVLGDGVWRYKPDLKPLAQLSLARAGVTADYQICGAGHCRPLGEVAPDPAAASVTLLPCPGPNG